ncbi:hypothetical protein [Candidatus Liberibacter sp.]|uniref:hypothetical protein n=1 Tax=Candidatus Liberibacter sp. TaxID=34022 RepID=UPI0015F6CAB2|nr:hypothetical protein [Candidatus Liberibacter sp.]MBA5724095.1 hypothetical protein [Candidatus Liberibacter sp.]
MLMFVKRHPKQIGAAISSRTYAKLTSLMHNLITPFGQLWHKLIFQKKKANDTDFENEKQQSIDSRLDNIIYGSDFSVLIRGRIIF